MPSSEHVRKLQEGARAWNAWRHANPRIEPQLGELNLPVGHKQFGAAQGGPIDLSQADLCRAGLEHATLIAADLTGAYLVQANLAHARLKGASLSGANLSDARLDHADLSDVELTAATLTGANLKDARNLTQAQIDNAYGDATTLLPPDLAMPARWRKDKSTRSRELARELAFEPVTGKLDAYALLGVSRRASLKDIRAAYVQLVKALHPDGRALDPRAAERLKAINKAYQELKVRARQPAGEPVRTRAAFRPRALFAIGFLSSSLTLLAVVGALNYLGVLGGSEEPSRLEQDNRPQGPIGSDGRQRSAQSAAPEDGAKRATTNAGEPDPTARAAADDAAWREAQREGTSASLHRYLGRYATGRHASEAMAALPAVANAEIALSQPIDAPKGTASARATLRHFLELYPNGRLAPEVERKLSAIAAAEAAYLADAAAWAEAERVGTAEGLRRYISAHPNGQNAAQARQAMVALEAFQARRAADHADWAEARADGGKASLHRYLLAHPDGDHAAEARLGLDAIEARETVAAADRALWVTAQAAGSKAALEDYLAAYPQGQHAVEARDKLQALAAAPARPDTQRLAHARSLAGDPEPAPTMLEPLGEPAQDPLSAPQKMPAAPEASSAAADDARLRDDADWLKAQRRNTKAAYTAYLLTHPNGRHVKEARTSLTDLQAPPLRTKPVSAKGFRQITQAFGAGPADAPASQKWQSADEPFIGADGRLRQR
jgi:DnaJ domain/Pentapeptide repeats (8 copies)